MNTYRETLEDLARDYYEFSGIPEAAEMALYWAWARERDALSEGLYDNDGIHPDSHSGLALTWALLAAEDDDAAILYAAKRLRFRLRENVREYMGGEPEDEFRTERAEIDGERAESEYDRFRHGDATSLRDIFTRLKSA